MTRDNVTRCSAGLISHLPGTRWWVLDRGRDRRVGEQDRKAAFGGDRSFSASRAATSLPSGQGRQRSRCTPRSRRRRHRSRRCRNSGWRTTGSSPPATSTTASPAAMPGKQRRPMSGSEGRRDRARTGRTAGRRRRPRAGLQEGTGDRTGTAEHGDHGQDRQHARDGQRRQTVAHREHEEEQAEREQGRVGDAAVEREQDLRARGNGLLQPAAPRAARRTVRTARRSRSTPPARRENKSVSARLYSARQR